MIRYCLGEGGSPKYLYKSADFSDRIEVATKSQFVAGKMRNIYVDILETYNTGCQKLKVYWADGSVEELYNHQAVWDTGTIRIVDTDDTYPQIPVIFFDGRFNS